MPRPVVRLVPRHTLAASLLLAIVAVISGAAPSAAGPCPPLRLDAISPQEGGPGDRVQLTGEGFCPASRDYLAWGWNGARGFTVEIDGVEGGRLQGIVGPVPEKISGPVRLYAGKRERMKAQRLSIGGVRHRVRGSVLRIDGVTSGGDFSATATATGAQRTASSTVDAGGLRVAVPPPPPQGGPRESDGTLPAAEISVILVVETCGPPDDEEEEEEDDAASERFVGHLTVRCVDRGRVCLESQNPARVVASAIGRTFGEAGFDARPDGSDVVISRRGCPIATGFATLSR